MLPFQLPLCFVKRRIHGFLVLFQNLFRSFKNFFKTHYALRTWPLFLLLIPFLCQPWKQVASLKNSKMAYANTCMAKSSRSGRKRVLCWLLLCRLWPNQKGQILMKLSWLPLMPFSSSQWEVGSPPCLELKQWLASGLCIIPKKRKITFYNTFPRAGWIQPSDTTPIQFTCLSRRIWSKLKPKSFPKGMVTSCSERWEGKICKALRKKLVCS